MAWLEILLGGTLLGWIGLGIFHYWNFRGATVLRPESADDLSALAPSVTIILAARNEEQSLGATLAALAALDYADFEVILVNDDSADRTGEIAEDWARRPGMSGRLRVIHNRDLPAGWVGKVYALDLAARAARGEWILATDADVVFHPAVLRLAVSLALRRGASLLSLAPEFELVSPCEKVVMPVFSLLLATMFPVRLVNDPRIPRAIAAGAFILMRRSDLEALGGYARLRSAVIEDVRMAELFKRNGRRIFIAVTRRLFRTRMYQGCRELWEGLGRSVFEGAGFSVPKILVGAVAGNLMGVFPWVVAVARLSGWSGTRRIAVAEPALALALAACAASALVYLPVTLFLRISPLYVFTLPLGTLFYAGVALHSAWVSVFGRGVRWKGRRYRPPQ